MEINSKVFLAELFKMDSNNKARLQEKPARPCFAGNWKEFF
jgi:hypothetical protein